MNVSKHYCAMVKIAINRPPLSIRCTCIIIHCFLLDNFMAKRTFHIIIIFEGDADAALRIAIASFTEPTVVAVKHMNYHVGGTGKTKFWQPIVRHLRKRDPGFNF